MLSLVRRIVEDVLHARQELGQKQPERYRLDRQRRTLDWPARARRYQLQEEIAFEENNLQEALAELEVLGVVLLDPGKGQVGFPTIVNGRRAFFSWRISEETLRHWHFDGEKVRRLIPSAWKLEPGLSAADER
jgi:hypothetical protein